MVKLLSVNDENDIPGTVVVVEVETVQRPDEIYPDRTIHTLGKWAATAARMENGKWTREKSSSGTEASDLWTWINYVRRSGSPVWLFGQNVGQTLTLLALWSLVESGDYLLSRPCHPDLHKARTPTAIRSMSKITKGLLVTGGPPTAIVVFHRDRWKLTCLDIRNYLDKSSSELASLSDCGYNTNESSSVSTDESGATISNRLSVSTDIVRRLIVWHYAQELGRFSLTVTGIAMASLRHRFMRDRIELPEEQDERDWEREAFFNGRVEALWAGRIKGNGFTPVKHIPRTGDLFEDRPVGPFHIVDARSFYAAVETFEELPIAVTESHVQDGHGPPDTGHDLREVMASVLIDSPADTYPVRRGAGCLYAAGTFWTRLCGPELVRAVRAGHVRQWGGWRRYRLSQCLRWFAEGFWKERTAADSRGDKVVSALCKSIMACLHGKFLQRSPKWSLLPGRIPSGPWEHWMEIEATTGRTRRFRSIGYDVQIQDDGGDDKYCFPALAAWVTSHGREYLRSWCRVAGERHVLYVATDSLIVDNVGLDNLTAHGLIWPDGVGSLRVVRSHADIEIRGPNNYTHDGRNVVGGRSLRDLRVAGQEWTAARWQGLEETFLSPCRDEVVSYALRGSVDNCTTPGKVGPGGWLQPPRLTTEVVRCQESRYQDQT